MGGSPYEHKGKCSKDAALCLVSTTKKYEKCLVYKKETMKNCLGRCLMSSCEKDCERKDKENAESCKGGFKRENDGCDKRKKECLKMS